MAAKILASPAKNEVPKKIRILASTDNDVQLASAGILTGSIKIPKGKGNVIRFRMGSRFSGSIHIEGDGNLIDIGEHTHIRGRILVKGNNQRVVIGDHTTSVEVRLLCSEGCDIIIGRWCMFSRKIEVRTTDAHSVVDRQTYQRLNPASSVTIGDHVWVGLGAVINKGSSVPSDCIVGAMSFVNRPFEEEGVILAGIPAKVIRTGITWNRGKNGQFAQEELDFWKEG